MKNGRQYKPLVGKRQCFPHDLLLATRVISLQYIKNKERSSIVVVVIGVDEFCAKPGFLIFKQRVSMLTIGRERSGLAAYRWC